MTTRRYPLTEDNVGFAKIVVNRIMKQFNLGADILRYDMDQVALIAMMLAEESYEPSKGTFSTYVARPIAYALREYLSRSQGVRVPRSTRMTKHLPVFMPTVPHVERDDRAVTSAAHKRTEQRIDGSRALSRLTPDEATVFTARAIGVKWNTVLAMTGLSLRRAVSTLNSAKRKTSKFIQGVSR